MDQVSDERLEAEIERVGKATGESFCGWRTAYSYVTQAWFWRFRLHIFWTAEPGRVFHDHSGDFWTFPTRSYVEHVLDTETGEAKTQIVRRFRVHHRPAEHTHKYLGRWSGKGVDAMPGAVVTLVYHKPVRREWFYWSNHRGKAIKYAWRRYLRLAGRGPYKVMHDQIGLKG